ncbi:transcriptional regulator MalT [Vibrio breoganii]|uniref:HTH-type transcriptional regulator MalT n=1 Tax=Vibrio breoganii TaxID=553239 RepID=UPI000C838A46|nr:HTH-type transcriptional regulator MalT [Vibrio breoganii]PMG36710.1 transcriptional regulator MalT [Vibrio breoganii]PMK31113.1 transcriptional regulator MalT [Vibrio breoganii]PML53457.1 transcriptional regulator MalT [Vibrio breoganii]PMO78654.1 transcriptional regulator MalT [Vibrio breoganii]PMP09176.1 transcriptional regulator MalT [Vibrio breoganii]
MWIPSKLTRPGRLHNAIVRPRVLDLLQQAPFYKLVLLRSPAGYGKTTMAAQWLSDKAHVGWYNLDESDNDSYRFINYFIQALNKATDNACTNSQALIEKRQYSSLHSLFGEIFGELTNNVHETYLVLDDYHFINNEEIHEAMRFFIKHMPDNLTVVVTSRSNPPLGTANLRVRDLMIEIDDDLLAFDKEETTRFFNMRMKEEIDETTADDLRTYAEGWPSAMQLIAVQALQQNKPLQQSLQNISEFNHTHLWDYLAEEVFDFVDADTKEFLMQCSVLDNFSDQLIIDVTGREDALSMLENLNKYGLFLSTASSENNWYRFHNLFSEFLSHQRHTHLPQQEVALQTAAAQSWLKHDRPIQALVHAQRAKDSELCASIMQEHGWKMFNSGELTTLEKAIAELDTDQLYKTAKLPLLRAWLAQSQHRFNTVGDLLAEAKLELDKRNIPLSIKEQGQVRALRAQVAINQGKPEEALRLAELALSQIDNNDFRSRIVGTSVIGEVNHVLGRLDRALPMMQQTEKLARQYQVFHHVLWALIQQSEILIAQGYIQAAYELQDQAFKLIEEHHFQQVPLHEHLLRTRAQIQWCWNRLDDAELSAYKGIDVLANQPSGHLHSYSMLVRVAMGRGELDKAGRFVKNIEALLAESNYHIDWSANASFSQILYWQASKDITAIHNWLIQTETPTDATNHFNQLQLRNIARAQIACDMLEEAEDTIAFLQEQANTHGLVTDINRNLIVETVLNIKLDNEVTASEKLKTALSMTNQTGMLGNFIVDGATINKLLEKLVNKGQLGDLERHRALQLLKEIGNKQRSRAVHFDEEFVNQLVNHPNIPELIRTSPLTQREWQVLNLIYSGFSNEQIAQELDVAGTTIKTHIRNLYQKLNIANRKEAIETAENLLRLMGY